MKFALWVTTIVALFAVYCVFHADGAGGEDQGAGASGSGHQRVQKAKGKAKEVWSPKKVKEQLLPQVQVLDNANTYANETKSERELNYQRILALCDMATREFLKIFHERWARLMELEQQNSNKMNWEDGPECGRKLLKIYTYYAIPMNDIMVEKIPDGEASEWDLTLLLSAVQVITRHIKSIQQALNRSSSPRSPYADDSRHFHAIRIMHNKITHCPSLQYTKEEFEPLWQQMTNALAGLGIDRTEMDEIKTMNMPQIERNYLHKIEDPITKKQLLPAEELQENANEFDNEPELKSKYNCLHMLSLRDMAADVLIRIFRKRWKLLMQLEKQDTSKIHWKDGPECGERLFQIFTDNEIPMFGIMKILRDGDTTKWDVTLVASAIDAITKTIQKDHNTNNSSSPFENEDKHISAIRTVRNEVAHSRLSEFTDSTFEPLWQQLTNALAGLGVARTDMEKIITTDFTATASAQSEADQKVDKANMEKIKKTEFVPNFGAQLSGTPTQRAQPVAKQRVARMEKETIKTSDISATQRNFAEAERAKANVAFKAGKFGEAIDQYTRILRIEGLSADYQADIYSNRSEAYLRQSDDSNRLSKAIQNSNIAVQMSPTWWRGYQQSSLSNAISDARLAIQASPTGWRGYHRLGMAYKSKGKLEKALEQLKAALALGPPEGVKQTLIAEGYDLHHQIRVQKRAKDLALHPKQDSEEELATKFLSRHGLSMEEFQDLKKMARNRPEIEEKGQSSSTRQNVVGFQHALSGERNHQYVPAFEAAAEKVNK